MNKKEENFFFERFLSPAERMKATHELANLGEKALPILESLFNGEAKNRFGVSYSKIGALDCGYITLGMLGIIAKPLEKYIRVGIRNGFTYAIQASKEIGDIEEDTLLALTEALDKDPFSSDSAYVIVHYGKQNTELVKKLIDKNIKAFKNLEWAIRMHDKHNKSSHSPH